MSTFRMSLGLREALLNAIDRELWNDADKQRCRTAVQHDFLDDDEIVREPRDDTDWDEHADEPITLVMSMIEYFGLEYVAVHGKFPPPVQ